MASLDIASSSSAYGEGFPNAIGEAMSCGVPCVVTDVGDSAKIVGNTGYIVPPRAPGALAKGWEGLIALGSDKRYELGMAARKRIVDSFRIESIVKTYEEFYSTWVENGVEESRRGDWRRG